MPRPWESSFVPAGPNQGWVCTKAAAFCGVAVDTLSKIETARGDVKLSSILTVCRMLGIHLIVEPWKE